MNILKAVYAALVSAALIATTGIAQANTVQIDFTAPDQSLTSTTYTEDGYIVDGSATTFGEIRGNELTTFFLFADEIFSITRTDNVLFSLLSFDIRTRLAPSDEFTLTGLVGGVEVVNFGTFSAVSTILMTESIMSSVLIDELQIVGTGNFGSAGPIWDNFVLSTDTAPVPVPAAAPLFAGGLLLTMLRRRRQYSSTSGT